MSAAVQLRIGRLLTKSVSLIFVFGFLGFMISGITNVYISDHFGFGIVRPLFVESAWKG